MPQVGVAARSPKFLRGGCRAAGRFPSARCRSRATPPAEANVRLSMPLCANSRATPFRKPCGVRIEGQSSQVEVGLFVCSCAGAAGVAEIVAPPRQEFHFMVTERGADTRGVPVML